MTYNPQKPDADPISLDKRIAEQENVDYSTLATKEYLDSKTGGSTGGGSSSRSTSSSSSGTGLWPNKTIIDWSVVQDVNTFYECDQGLVCCFTFPTGNSVILRAWCFAPGKWNGFVTRMRIMYVTAYSPSTYSYQEYAGAGAYELYNVREVDFPLGNKNLFFQMYENFKPAYSSKDLRLFFHTFRNEQTPNFDNSYSCFLDIENEKLYIADKAAATGNPFCAIGVQNIYNFEKYFQNIYNFENWFSGTHANPEYNAEHSEYIYKQAGAYNADVLSVFATVLTLGNSNMYYFSNLRTFMGRQDLGRAAYSPYFTFDNFTLKCTDHSTINTVLDACGMFLPFETQTEVGEDYETGIPDYIKNYLPDPVIARIQA